MKKIFIYLVFIFLSASAWSQDDLLAGLEDTVAQEARPLTALFKGNRLINGHTTETTAKNHLDFKIHHRFGKINDGAYQLFGLDQADMMMAFEYGVSKKLTLGLARNSFQKMYTGSMKYKFFGQTGKGKHHKAFTLTYYGNISVNTLSFDTSRVNYFSSRLSYVHQFLIARKFGETMTLQLMPMVYHQNLVAYNSDPNDLYVLGMGGSFKMTRSSRFNVEYYPVLNRGNQSSTTNALSVGVDIETGGHVFQLMIGNTRGMVENNMIPYTKGSWRNGDLYFGFNLCRYFSLKR